MQREKVGAFERLPKWLNLVPMVLQWAWLGLRHGSITLPSSANPNITAGGLVGDTKSEYFECMGSFARARVAPYVMLSSRDQCPKAFALEAMQNENLDFPVVAKPDLGWCGYGVRRIDNSDQLDAYLDAYPPGASLMLQRYLDEPGEAGIFYARHPQDASGGLIGVLLRHYPQIIGDGLSTVAQLIGADARLRRTTSSPLHDCDGDYVPGKDEVVRLSLIASTRVGGRYEDGTQYVTPALTAAIEAIAQDMPQFHVGRFDVRYRTLHDLRCGRFTIMEVNGAGSEAVHAWDPKYSIAEVYRIVFAKQRVLFSIAAANRAKGHRPIGMLALARHHLHQQRLIKQYPRSN
ncbi:MAG: hypothetical protein ABIR16_01555 [Dokdonella sp.]